MRATLDDLVHIPLWSLSDTEAADTARELVRLEARVTELKSRTLARVDSSDVPADAGATSTANWLAHQTQTIRTGAHRAMRLAHGLRDHDQARVALAEGRLQVDQAEAILRGLADLPADADPDLVAKAEAHLIDQARDFDAKALKHLARHVLEVACPDQADAHQAQLLDREERDAAKATQLVIWDDGHGKVHGRFTLDTLTGAALKKALLALAAPRHRATQAPLGERRPTPERMGQAFTELIHRYPSKKLPQAGGLNATIVVLMPLETLMGGLKAARLDTGETISPSLARRLACQAGIVPAVLDGDSHILDLGRKQRFHTPAQRLAAIIEQGRCNAEGCDYPPGLCQLHHPIPWHLGGQTNRDGMLLCPRHHTRAHDPTFTLTKLPTGRVTFHRRT
jgi:hypothetical protein